MSRTIAMIGTGYVGLVTGACFAEIGHSVVCIDNDAKKIEILQSGRLPIYETGLDELVARNVASGRLSFSTNIAASVKGRDAVFICVGTPSDHTGRANLDYVYAAASEVAAALDGFAVVVTKSTVPVGTNRRVSELLKNNLRAGATVAVASNPEFLREGSAIVDFMEPDRIVIGVEDPRAAEIMRAIYAPLTNTATPLVETGIETAEIIKYAANGFLAVKLSFINEVSDLCEAVGADIEMVSRGIGLDRRIGSAFLKVGPGWGGSCFPKDSQALHATAQDVGIPVRIIEAAIEANTSRKKGMARRIVNACGGSVAGKKVAILGLTFKGQTDDMRDSPSLDILPMLHDQGARVHAFDPARPPDAPKLLPQVVMEDDPLSMVKDADVLAVVTEWKEFRAYDLAKLAAAMNSPVMVDLRNLFTAEEALRAGFKAYYGLGSAVPAYGQRRLSDADSRLKVVKTVR